MTPPSTGSPPVNWPLLGGLRFVLALVVAVAHVPLDNNPITGQLRDIAQSLNPGAAVVAFLMLSGFSIAASIDRNPNQFYRRRVERLVPTYFMCLLLTMGVCGLYYFMTTPEEIVWPELPSSFGQWLGTITMLNGIFAPVWPVMLPTWTLTIEIVFYAIAPYLRRLPRSYIWWGVAVSAMAHKALSLWPGAPLVPVNIVGLFYVWIAGWLIYQNGTRFTWPLIVLVIIVWNQSAAVIGITGLAIIYGPSIQLPRTLKRVCDWLGDASYPLYLSHPAAYFLIGLMALWTAIPQNTATCVILALLCAGLIAALIDARKALLRRLRLKRPHVSTGGTFHPAV